MWCTTESLYDPNNIIGIKKFGGGNIMVWGCITYEGVGKIIKVSNKINSQEYCETLYHGLIGTYSSKNMKPSEYTFQQDNASCHSSVETKNWLRTQNINFMVWPANSPDINPIENVWAYLNKKLRARINSFSNGDRMWEILEDEWYKIPKEYIQKLYFSMCARIKSVIKAKGRNTKY